MEFVAPKHLAIASGSWSDDIRGKPMNFVVDLHLHSRYSRAVSQAMNLKEMAKWARLKGLDILSAADFTHPLWIREIKSQLEEASEGLYKLKSQNANRKTTTQNSKVSGPLFLLSTEIACIYKQGEKLRRIHNLIFAPSLEIVDKITSALLKRGANLSADGRPIIGMSSRDLLELILTIDRTCILIPAHAWTPHFGIYGSASGFDSLQEAFGDLSKFVYGIETGLSSDPLMNWQIKELDNRSILSFSDAHSAPKMGREATVFAIDKRLETLTYTDLGRAIAGPQKAASSGQRLASSLAVTNAVAYTIEFYPEEGKYHYTGHRNCKVVKTPEEIKKDGNICPVCKRRLTEGVMYRVSELADANEKRKTKNEKCDEHGVFWIEDPNGLHPPFVKLVPLNEIIAESLGSPVTSPKVKDQFAAMCEDFGSEIEILLKTNLDNLAKKYGEKIAEGVRLVRKGGIVIDPGYDGEYGHVRIWDDEKRETRLPSPEGEANGGQGQLGLDI